MALRAGQGTMKNCLVLLFKKTINKGKPLFPPPASIPANWLANGAQDSPHINFNLNYQNILIAAAKIRAGAT
jgi:hypothetical protein